MSRIGQMLPLYILFGVLIGVCGFIAYKQIEMSKPKQEDSAEKMKEMELMVTRMKEAFGAISGDVLAKSTQQLVQRASESLSKQANLNEKELEGKKKLIDQRLEEMGKSLTKVEVLMNSLEKDRAHKFGELTTQIKSTAEQTEKLRQTADDLKSALASTKIRGQWGERMAEDVLRMAGFIEGINYLKQKALESVTSRPDYTFLLPQNLKVNMDVKFPLNSYLRFIEAKTDNDKKMNKDQFLKDVKARIKEVTTRDYINPSDNTVDYVIVFIPNEQVYAFINENYHAILEEAMQNKVIICSPLTLYAILAVIRQAVDNFKLEKTAAEMYSLMGAFNKQWQAFQDSLDKMGKRIEDAKTEYDHLTTTRRNQLEKPLRKIEDLRIEKGLPISGDPQSIAIKVETIKKAAIVESLF